MFWRRKSVLNTQEAGKAISTSNMEKVQGIHDASFDMGADCATPMWGGVYESARIWEAAIPMSQSHDELRGQLRDALNKAHGTNGDYYSSSPYVRDVFPNHVVYSHQGQMYKRGYTVTHDTSGGTSNVTVDEKPKKVHTAYVDSSSPDGKESMIFLTDMPGDTEEVQERYISKAARDKMDSKDFAGKHKSFPIETAADVDAALKSIGRAGSDNHDAATLKSNILRIAKRKGYAVPKSDQGESVLNTLPEDAVMVTESAEWCIEADQVVEFLTAGAKEAVASGKSTVIPVKIIGPGQGSMAFYSKEMIASSGPKAFGKGTHMYWNHATESEQIDRAEGDLNDLAAVLTEDAAWNETGPKGPGLYSKAKVFSDYATQVAEKGAHIGISINTPIKFTEGEVDGKHTRIAKEFIKSPLTSADFVTRAGAKGAPIVTATESERRSQITTKENTMTPEEQKKLQDDYTALLASNAKLQEGANVELAVSAVSGVLKEAGVPVNDKVVRRLCATPTMKEGQPDPEWVKSICTDLCEGVTGTVKGMGNTRESATTEVTEKDTKVYESAFRDLGMSEKGASIAVKGAE